MRGKTDASAQRLYNQESDYQVVDRVIDLAKKRGVSNAQIALAWMLHKPGITSPIIGATKPHHLQEAEKALEVQLSEVEIEYLEEPYPPHQVLGIYWIDTPSEGRCIPRCSSITRRRRQNISAAALG